MQQCIRICSAHAALRERGCTLRDVTGPVFLIPKHGCIAVNLTTLIRATLYIDPRLFRATYLERTILLRRYRGFAEPCPREY